MIERLGRLKQWLQTISKWLTPEFVPVYRLVDVVKSQNDEHELIVQVVHKNITFSLKPEELLADDSIVDLFSPRDIRTLTYLGYLDMNSPKYKILAKRLTKSSHIAFALERKSDQQVIIKTPAEIMQEKMLNNLDANDAQLVGYTAATESVALENKQKHHLTQSKRDEL
ncbi:MAG: hypothetical protein NXI01_06165 [Gammaproteobacteria bacterium]|nr:hypothetical protein [Gammaproteobacteria bacterium]